MATEKEQRPTAEQKAKLLIEEVKFSLMVPIDKHALLIASRIQRERMETLNEYGIFSEYETTVSNYLLNIKI